MTPDAFHVPCPVCRADLTISSETRSVLAHKEARAPKPVADLDEAAKKLRRDPERREELFKTSLDSEKTKSEKLKKSFDELLKHAKDEPLERPTRDLDLD